MRLITRTLIGLAVLATAACGQPEAAAGPPVPGGADEPVQQQVVPSLPAGLVAADDARLTGRWEPAAGTRAPKRPHVVFEDGGTWTGSDGCNGGAGDWATGPGGELRAGGGPRTKMACDDMVDVPGWIDRAVQVGMDGDELVLLDESGTETGRLHRA